MLGNTADEIVLGKVNLQTGQSYTFCRNLCKNTYPDFEIYQKFEDYNFCTCSKITPGQNMTILSHGAYDFGYAKECGKYSAILPPPNGTLSKSQFKKKLIFFNEISVFILLIGC